jgi:CRP-like cAMP-binding protein
VNCLEAVTAAERGTAGHAGPGECRGRRPGVEGRPPGLLGKAIRHLKQCPPFDRLTPAECARLEARARVRAFRPREFVYYPAEPGQTVLLLTRGRVKTKALTPDGRESILAFFEAGDLFGELALLDAAPRGEYAEAVEASQVLALPREELLWLMGRRPDVALHVTRLLGLRRRRVESRLRNTLFRTVRERTVALLLELLEAHGQWAGGRWEVRPRLTHQDLANLIGATRETVTATLGRLRREGLIEVRRRRLHVLDRARLAAEGGRPAEPSEAEPVARSYG